MKSIISILFLLQAIINTVNLVTAQFPAEPVFRCRDTGNYTTRTDYSRNLKVALNTVGNMDTYNGGSFNSSIGVNEAAHVMALCSSISTHWGGNCKDCIHKLTVQLTIKCLDQKEAVMWGSNCMIHFSDRKILGSLDDWSRFSLPDKQAGSLANKPDQFDNLMFFLMHRLKLDASRGTTNKKSEFKVDYENKPVYGAMQCTADLSRELCDKCLQELIVAHRYCCSGRKAARIFSPNCFFSYSGQDFSKWKT